MKILVVEDDRLTRTGLERILAPEAEAVRGVPTLEGARAALSEFDPDVCVIDLKLPDGDGLDFLREARSGDARREVIVLTGNSSIDTAVEAMKAGAFDYLLKPLKPAQIQVVLERLTEKRSLEREVDDLRGQLAETGRFGAMIGKSAPMQAVFQAISRVAKSDAPVLILGESGTGKEVAATTLHQLSRRKAKRLVAINCGAVSPTLIESELFGHERGAFTGADRRHEGYFEMSHGGTLFLDEVTEMPGELQVKLLRVLEARTFRRVGGNEELSVDVRIVSSTNRRPEEAIRDGKLREDLYYRLGVFPLQMPPLRERAEDIPLLAQHFLESIEAREQAGIRSIEPAGIETLQAQRWAGNVRELKNVIHRAHVLSNPPTISAEAIRSVLGNGFAPIARPAPPSRPSAPGGKASAPIGESVVRKTMKAAGGDVRKAAAMLKITAAALQSRLKQLGLEEKPRARPPKRKS